MDFFGQDDNQSKMKEEQSAMGGSVDGKGASPQKSLAIKGPPKIISDKLEIANYQGVKVTDINVRPVNASVAHIRAQREMNGMQSNRNLDESAYGEGRSGLNKKHSGSQGLHAMSQGGGTDNGSRVFSADNAENQANNAHQVNKTIISYLNDKITTFLMSG